MARCLLNNQPWGETWRLRDYSCCRVTVIDLYISPWKITMFNGKIHYKMTDDNLYNSVYISLYIHIWVWVNTYENTIFSGMNIHFNPAILM